MQTIYHPASGRGHIQMGWLDTYHSFSFGNYFDRHKMHFGMLRVLNDDTIAPDTGFGMHPHDNMEIITIPLSGTLRHEDSLGSAGTIQAGEIQIMSAGTGIVHSEANPSLDEPVKLFQIWIIPEKQHLKPRYDQFRLPDELSKNQWHTLVSPTGGDGMARIFQRAWISQGHLEGRTNLSYTIQHPENGVYVMVVEGKLTVGGQLLKQRDALGIWDTQSPIVFEANDETKVLLLDVPMTKTELESA